MKCAHMIQLTEYKPEDQLSKGAIKTENIKTNQKKSVRKNCSL